MKVLHISHVLMDVLIISLTTLDFLHIDTMTLISSLWCTLEYKVVRRRLSVSRPHENPQESVCRVAPQESVCPHENPIRLLASIQL